MPDPVRLAHRLAELAGCSRADAEQYIQNGWVSVDGDPAPYSLRRLSHGLSYGGRELPPCKVSWQSETRLRFGRIPLGKGPEGAMPPGQWRYLPVGEKF